jgi:Flp pilus assembly pilin Flp
MANEVTVTITGKDNASKTFGNVRKSADDYGDSLDTAGGKADEAERRTLGLKDTVDGLGAIMQGPHGKQGIGGYIQGWADLSGGIANFVIPSLKNAWKGMLSLATQTGRATLMANIHKGAQMVGAVATRAMTMAQRGLNAAMRANPIGIIITILALLVTGIIIAYKKSETFRRIVQGAWRGIAAAAKWAWETVIKPVGRFLVKAFHAYIDAALAFGRGIRRVFNAVVDKFKDMIAYVRGVPGKIKERFSNAAKLLLNSGRRIVDGLKDGIKEKVRGIKDWVKTHVVDKLINAVKNFFGIKSPSTVFAGIGKNLMLGLGKGLMKVSPTALIKKTFGGMSGALSSMIEKGLIPANNLPSKAINAYFGSALRFGKRLGSFFAGQQPVPGVGRRHGSGYPWADWAGDFPNPTGTPVRAWRAGIVTSVKRLLGSYGHHIRINHGTARTLYAHLSQELVRPGQFVRSGQLIGMVGSTGNSTGPHLHFEKYARGGVINEPVIGMGQRSGKGYMFGEAGPETVTPGVGGGTQYVEVHIGNEYLGRFVSTMIGDRERSNRRKVTAGNQGGW